MPRVADLAAGTKFRTRLTKREGTIVEVRPGVGVLVAWAFGLEKVVHEDVQVDEDPYRGVDTLA